MAEPADATARIDKRDCRRLLGAVLLPRETWDPRGYTAPEPGGELPIWESSAISQDAPDLVRFRRPRPEVADREPTRSGRT
jgi:hypothetical protein